MEDILTETPAEAPVEVLEDELQEEAGPQTANCRHCGHEQDVDDAGSDWLCEKCERYQDAMVCPTCGQLARVSAMPANMVPEAHAPVRRRRAREG